MAEDRAAEVAAELLRLGHNEVEFFGDLKVGSRVRHSGQRWPDAYRLGTGNVERIFHRPNSAWEQKYGRPDVELIVKRDDGTHSFVADYHVALSESAS